MLILSRKKNEQIILHSDIIITVIEIRGDKVRLGIQAPASVPVHRMEVYELLKKQDEDTSTKSEWRGIPGMTDEFEPELGQMLCSNSVTQPLELNKKILSELYDIGFHLEEQKKTIGNPTENCGDAGYYENDVFCIRAYCWCDGDEKGHENGCPPNFEYKPLGFKVSWYKHAGRGASQSHKLGPTEISDMFSKVWNSIS